MLPMVTGILPREDDINVLAPAFDIRPTIQPRANPRASAAATSRVVSTGESPPARRTSGLVLPPSLDGNVSPKDAFGGANATFGGASITVPAAGLARVPPGACDPPGGGAPALAATYEIGMGAVGGEAFTPPPARPPSDSCRRGQAGKP